MTIKRSELDDKLMHENLLKTYGTKVTGFHVSTEHYRYLAEQIVSLRRLTTLQRAYLQRNSFPPSGESSITDPIKSKSELDDKIVTGKNGYKMRASDKGGY